MITKTANRTRLSMSGLTYDFTFRIDDDSELLVYGITAAGVATLITTGYSVAWDAEAEEGTVTFVAEPTTYAEILMLRSKPYTQTVDIPIRGGFDESVIEKNGLDNVVMQVQQLKELIDYSVKQDPTSVAVDVVLPTPVDGKLLAWDGVTGAMKNETLLAGPTGPQGATGPAGADGLDGIFSAIASQAEAEAGAENTKGMTALRTAQAIAALSGLKVYFGISSRNLADATSDVAYTGFGFEPKLIIVYGALSSGTTASIGAGVSASANQANCIATPYNGNTTGTWETFRTRLANFYAGVGAATEMAIKSIDADGFTATFTKVGSPTGSPEFYIIALG